MIPVHLTFPGGWVSHGRVMHTLAVSRAIGDRDFKLHSYADSNLPFRESLVIPTPEIRVCRLAGGEEEGTGAGVSLKSLVGGEEQEYESRLIG